ncbi:MAG: HEAT repeat domain-containing protein [Melioribacteraceae bacterium]
MKTRLLFAVVIVTTILFNPVLFAGENKSVPAANTYEAIELNRLIGLASDNEGLKVSCAFNLGEMKSQKAVIPLIAMLRDGKTDEERIIAALSLMKIRNAQGVYMVSRAAKFNNNERVRYICEKFYNGYLLEKENTKTTDAVASL